jgi:hypothetical protein
VTPKAIQKFLELRKRDGTNNYGSWAIKAKRRLIALELWEYVAGDQVTPPQVTILLPPEVIRGPDANGHMVEIHLAGNQPQVDTAKEAVAPWQKKNDQALNHIINAIQDDLLYLVK